MVGYVYVLCIYQCYYSWYNQLTEITKIQFKTRKSPFIKLNLLSLIFKVPFLSCPFDLEYTHCRCNKLFIRWHFCEGWIQFPSVSSSRKSRIYFNSPTRNFVFCFFGEIKWAPEAWVRSITRYWCLNWQQYLVIERSISRSMFESLKDLL